MYVSSCVLRGDKTDGIDAVLLINSARHPETAWLGINQCLMASDAMESGVNCTAKLGGCAV